MSAPHEHDARVRRRTLSLDEYVAGVEQGDRALLTPVTQRRAEPRVFVEPIVQALRTPARGPGGEQYEGSRRQAWQEYAE